MENYAEMLGRLQAANAPQMNTAFPSVLPDKAKDALQEQIDEIKANQAAQTKALTDIANFLTGTMRRGPSADQVAPVAQMTQIQTPVLQTAAPAVAAPQNLAGKKVPQEAYRSLIAQMKNRNPINPKTGQKYVSVHTMFGQKLPDGTYDKNFNTYIAAYYGITDMKEVYALTDEMVRQGVIEIAPATGGYRVALPGEMAAEKALAAANKGQKKASSWVPSINL